VVATKGAGSNEEARIHDLLGRFNVTVFPFDRARKAASFWGLLREVRSRRHDLVVMEGTGLAGGLALLLGRLLAGVPFVVSSGDAVGPFVGAKVPLLGPLFGLYERLLCGLSAGFIGWTPYLAGRALSFGAPRAMTAPGWAPFDRSPAQRAAARERVRRRLGVRPSALVVGIAGSLVWDRRRGYCYGHELVRALGRVRRDDVVALVVGDGDGRPHLEALAGATHRDAVRFTGGVPQSEVPDYLAAMDLASLPQSLDGVGSFRYTTKLSEYLAAGLPVVTGQIPFAYDLDDGWLWRLPGASPWDPLYVRSLAELLDRLGERELRERRRAVPRASDLFDRERQVRRATAFVADILRTKAPRDS
jgi:glycosyltransferase involved in cell wall biosynthesis